MFSDSRNRRTRIVLTTVLAIAVLCAVAATSWLVKPSGGVADAAPPPELATLEALERGFTWIAESVSPAVVFIEAEEKVAGRRSREDAPDMSPYPPDLDPEQWPDWFREFFGPGPSPRTPRQMPRMPRIGQGSGVVIDSSGYILTNNHVAGDATKVTVHLPDGGSYSADVVGADKMSDLAVIKIEPDHPLIAAKLGDADQANTGSWVVAIGYPFGGRGYSAYGGGSGRFDQPARYEPTVTVGVVSATERQLDSSMRGRPFRDLIQTDAPINPGSSGGPLVNIRGEIIGINQAIFTSGAVRGNIGVGFAIPINGRTKKIIETLKGGGTVVRGQLGVLVSPLTASIKEVYGAEHGVFVEDVLPDTPAERGGMAPEDIIVRYNGEEITAVDQFVGWVQATTPGSAAKIEVLRDGEPITLEVTVEALSVDVAAKKHSPSERDALGLTVESLSEERAQELGISGGVRVRSVSPGDGVRAGVQRGDVIVKVNRHPVTDVQAYDRIVGVLKPGDAVVMRLWRSDPARGDRILTAQIESLSE